MPIPRHMTELETVRFNVEVTVVAIKAVPEHPEPIPAAMRGFAKVLRRIADNAPATDEPGQVVDFIKGVSERELFGDQGTTKLLGFRTSWECLPH